MINKTLKERLKLFKRYRKNKIQIDTILRYYQKAYKDLDATGLSDTDMAKLYFEFDMKTVSKSNSMEIKELKNKLDNIRLSIEKNQGGDHLDEILMEEKIVQDIRSLTQKFKLYMDFMDKFLSKLY